MRHHALHSWNLTPAAARMLQRDLAARIDTSTPLPECRTIGAVDVSADRFDRVLTAGMVVWNVAEARVVESAVVQTTVTYPYVPGLLSFREIPGLVLACEKIQQEPDVILCDGQGTAHPRRLGVASHLGLWLDRPTIGCGKSRLCGTHSELPHERGARVPLLDKGETIGCVLRTRTGCKPLYVSVGHRCRLEDAVDLVLRLTPKYRLPDPIRHAHQLVYEARRRSLYSGDIP